jgi:hypothetical protein
MWSMNLRKSLTYPTELINTNAIYFASLRGAARRSNSRFNNEIAALPLVARNDSVTILYAPVLVIVQKANIK